MTSACAAIVERDDPHLYATALFAPEPARSRLMVLYAFDCELSRAVRASSESLIPRMRLQWWRDVITEAVDGKPAKAHEVAAPLSAILNAGDWSEADQDPQGLHLMIEGYEQELGGLSDVAAFRNWSAARFGTRTALAARWVGGRSSGRHDLAGVVLASAYALRNAVPMAVQGQAPTLPGLIGSDRAALARGELTGAARTVMQAMAGEALDALAQLRASRSEWQRTASPALLPLARAERVLRLVRRQRFELADIDQIDRPFDGLRLAWRAATTRW